MWSKIVVFVDCHFIRPKFYKYWNWMNELRYNRLCNIQVYFYIQRLKAKKKTKKKNNEFNLQATKIIKPLTHSLNLICTYSSASWEVYLFLFLFSYENVSMFEKGCIYCVSLNKYAKQRIFTYLTTKWTNTSSLIFLEIFKLFLNGKRKTLFLTRSFNWFLIFSHKFVIIVLCQIRKFFFWFQIQRYNLVSDNTKLVIPNEKECFSSLIFFLTIFIFH